MFIGSSAIAKDHDRAPTFALLLVTSIETAIPRVTGPVAHSSRGVGTRMTALKPRFARSIREFGEDEWDAVAAADLVMSHRWHRVMEASRPNYRPRYALVEDRRGESAPRQLLGVPLRAAITPAEGVDLALGEGVRPVLSR